MAALQLVQEIEDEKAKASRLEWCLREILAERDVLLRQHEDEARRKRQEELHSLNHHLNLNLHASVSSPCVVVTPIAPAPVPALNPHARPRSTSAPPAMITTPPALLPVGPPSAAAQPPPPPLLRPQPHSFRIVRQHQLQLQQQQLQHKQRQHQHQQGSCEAARLLGLSSSEAEAPTDTMVVDTSAKYQGPVKRARLGTSLPAVASSLSSSNQPNQLQLQPLRPATVVHHQHQHHQSAGVTARQSAPMTSVDANRFHPLQPHQVQHQHQHQHQHHGHDHHQHQHVCGGPNSAAGCESPVGCLPFGGTPPQCAAGVVAAAAAGGSLSASSSSSSFEWNNSCSSTAATPMPTPTLAGGDCATEWPLAGLNDEFDYDALLDNLSSGL
ncbi:uncharacterized protein ACA1_051500 [Acanthamoeba castellanii str. Neff]|uniref:Uncharacterized protein n=1 Tax=Acanthamoeba castellanii (strain ATCC 30010 / Neff) TaxID=1257118 RepID=L8GPS2_ACACF|nr:uncharacterized protein ACA1_051500 [Acanthamoeba castellanii str. Neff]ELR14927.1 hypothetical protein ACA1_051500 [Acanthamoeba castellanii str. Neff]